VFDITKRTMWWANAAARRLWEADSLDEMLARDYEDMSEATIVRLERYFERLQRGEVIVEQWTFYPRGIATTVRATFSGIDIEHGRLAMFSEAVPIASSQLEADALRGVEALRHTSAMISMYTPELKLLTANPAALSAFPDDGASEPASVGAPTRLPTRILDPIAREQLSASIRAGQPFESDLEVQTAAGPRWHSVVVRPTRDPLDGALAVLLNEEDVTVRKGLLASLEHAKATFASIVDKHSDGLVVVDEDGRVRFVNEAGTAMLGEGIAEFGSQVSLAGTVRELQLRGDDGSIAIAELRVLATSWEGQPARLAVVRDITELRRAEAARAELEEQVQQTQRLDSLGRLAGGVAHDFNNLLSVILGTADYLRLDMADDDPRREDIAAIVDAAQRGSKLTRQLLAVGRRQHGTLQRTDVHALIQDAQPLLVRVLGEGVEFEMQLGAERGNVMIDPSQLEQVILNLASNARQAMLADGGRFSIATRSVTLEAEQIGELGPGPYLELCAIDNGEGIAAEYLEHIFDPFFTTRDAAYGSGLGLATIYGIVRLAGGHVSVDSELGRGTSFTILWPEVEGEAHSEPAPEAVGVDDGGGRILLVDDERSVRRTVALILERSGYEVLSAAGPCEALELRREAGDVDLIVTDVVMPKMSGPALVEKLEALYGARPVVFMSGYASAAQSKLGGHPGFLPKPFTPAELLAKVRAQLGR
jgi:signal transduction histidine kinase